MDPGVVAEALVMRRAAGEFMRRGFRATPCPYSSLIRVHIALSWCAMGVAYSDAAQALHMSGAADEFLVSCFPRNDRRWRLATRLRPYVLRLYTTGREFDARR